MNTRLSTLWIFATLNYLYCDVVTLMDRRLLSGFLAGNVGGMDVTQVFLLGAGVLVEIPIAMVVLSRILEGSAARWTNVGAGLIMTIVQLASLFARVPAPYYLFFSIFEIGATATIVWLAWTSGRDGRRASLTPAISSHRHSEPSPSSEGSWR